jgi:hypothetical protein
VTSLADRRADVEFDLNAPHSGAGDHRPDPFIERKVKEALIAKVMALVEMTRNDALSRPAVPKP